MTLTLSAVIVVLLLLVGLPMVFISVQIQRQESAREQQALADQIAQTVSGIVKSIQANQPQISFPDQNDPRINLIATQITTGINLSASRVLAQIQEALQKDDPLETLLEANPHIQGLAQFNVDGSLEASAWRSPELTVDMKDFSQTESFYLAQQGLNAQNTFFLDQRNTPTLVVATPIFDREKVGGVVVAWIDVQSIWQSLTDLRVGDTGYLYIIDQSNQPVIVPAQDTLLTGPDSMQAAIQANKSYRGLMGRQVVGYIAPVEDTPWQVVIEIPTTEANASMRSLLFILGAILMFGVWLAISVARLFSNWILQPIQTLHQSALQISSGDLSHRIELDRADELGFLASAFNQMVATLEQTINELRTLSRRLLSAEEAERRRIAHEIHDELGQTLTALKFSLSMAMRISPDNDSLTTAQEMASEAQEKARTLSHELRPTMLDELGLLPTLEWYIDRLEQRANLAVSLETELDEANLPTELKITLYRLIVEALTNISKHAQASAVEVSLTQAKDNLTLLVADDGQGFDTSVLNHTQSLGLVGMRERINLLRGNFVLESIPGKGTKITVTLPL
jgi:signal transduction histidine kinase